MMHPDPQTRPTPVPAPPASLLSRPARCHSCRLRGAALCHALHEGAARGARPPALRRIARGKLIVEQDAMPGFFGVIRRGFARRSTMRLNGKRVLLGLAGPGDLVGGVPGQRIGCDLEAATDMELCLYDEGGVKRSMTENQAVMSCLLREVETVHRRLLDELWRYGTLTSRERITAFLVQATGIMPVEPQPDGSLILSMEIDRRDWADLTNTAVETISRTLRYLEDKDLVESLSPYRFRIRDLARLADVAGVTPPVRTDRLRGWPANAPRQPEAPALDRRQ